MTETTNFPAPTVAMPTLTPPPALEAPVAEETTVALPTPSADDARDTAERARTLGANVPAGMNPAPVDTPEGKVLIMPYAGYDFKVYPAELTGEVYDWMVSGLVTKAVQRLIKREQWNLIKHWHMSDVKRFLDEIGKLDLMGK